MIIQVLHNWRVVAKFAVALVMVCAWGALAQTAHALDWPSFRGSSSNNAVMSQGPSFEPKSAQLKWAKSFGSAYAQSPSPQVITNGALYVMANKKLYSLDLETGEELASAELSASTGYSYVAPTYDSGTQMVYAPMTSGKIEAFSAPDAQSLDLAWTYQDELGGQCLVPPVVADGKVYTGFWNGEERQAAFVCLNAQDGSLIWSTKRIGGFYWAQPLVHGQSVIIAGDNGRPADEAAANSQILVCSKETGELVDGSEVPGDVRSSVVYDEGRVVFTTKAGYLCNVALSEEGALSDLRMVKIARCSTSTPAIVDGVAYVGTDDSTLVSVDLNTMSVVSTVATNGPVKSSPLALTSRDGAVDLFFTCNANRGGLYMVSLPRGSVAGEEAEAVELIYRTAYRQYCISSPITDGEGNLYYKNDSGSMFALELSRELPVIDPDEKSDQSDSKSSDKDESKPATSETGKKTASVVSLLSLNVKTVDKKTLGKALKKARGTAKGIKTVVLGPKVRKVSKQAFTSLGKLAKVVVRTKKLSKRSVKGSLKGSKVKVIQVKVGSKASNKRYVKKYRKLFTRKNAGRSVSVRR